MLGSVVVSREEIDGMISRLASELEADLEGRSPVFIGVLIWLMAIEGNHTELTRIEFFGESTFVPEEVHH